MKGKVQDYIDLTTEQYELVGELLRRHLPGTEVWAYGSRVKFTSHADSDLDLVAFASPEQEQAIADLRTALAKSGLPFEVELFAWDDLPKSFHKNIRRQKLVLQQGAGDSDTGNGWQHVDLGQVAEVTTGKSNAVDATPDGPYPLFDRSQVIKRSDRFLFDAEAVIVPGEGAQFLPRYFKGKFDLHQRAYAILPSSKVDGRYLHYAILHGRKHFARVAVGSTVKSLRRHSFLSFPLPLPPLPEQRAIAHILGTLDDKIELNRRMAQTLEAIAQALFKSWFIDFDPVIDNALAAGSPIPQPLQARAAVRAPLARGGGPLPPDLRALFPSAFTHTDDLGWIPEGWEAAPLGTMLTPKAIRAGGEAMEEFSCSNNGIFPRSDRYRKTLSKSADKNKVAERGDFVFGLSRRILNFGLMREPRGSFSPVYKVYATGQPFEFSEFLYLSMLARPSYYYRAVSASSREGQSTSQGQLFSLKALLPPKAVVEEFFKAKSPMDCSVEVCGLEVQSLGEMRDMLLSQLLSGSTRVTRGAQV